MWLFAPLEDDSKEKKNAKNENTNVSLSLSNHTSVARVDDYSNLFDTSAQLEFGLLSLLRTWTLMWMCSGVWSTSFDISANDISYVVRDDNLDGQNRGQMTSTPPTEGEGQGEGEGGGN